MMNLRAIGRVLAATAASVVLGIGAAQAAPLSTYLQSGSNVVEDDSNEYLFRPVTVDGQTTYQLVTSGNIQQNDILVQILDFPIINGTNIDAATDELTGIALQVVTSVGAPTVEDTDGGGPVPPYNAVDLTFGAATAQQWSDLTGIDTTTLAFDTTGLVALIYYDEQNNLDVYTDAYPNPAIADATDGTLTFALALNGGATFASATNVPQDIATFLPSVGETPGVTQYGSFNYLLSTVYENIDGNVSAVTGSGTNLVTDRQTIAEVIDDTQASFTITQVPEPATVALLGAALMGLAGFSRSRKN